MAAASGTAAATLCVRPTAPGLRPCSCAGGAPSRGAGKWWAPLLGWSGQPDYIDAQLAPAPQPEEDRTGQPAAGARRYGVLTEEKARQLRLRLMETESFHDAMYHSAIASRLASAVPDTTRRPKP